MIKKCICNTTFEAIQWTGNNYEEIKKFGGRNVYLDNYNILFVWSERGRLTAAESDFVIKDDCGTLWVCSKDLFNHLFEEI